MKHFILAGLTAAMAASSAQAQTDYHFHAPESPAGATTRHVLPAGTPLAMRTRTQISSQDNKPGDRIYLEVAENVMYRDQIVIPVGSPVTAEVAAMQRTGHFGKKGKLEIRLIEAMTPHGPVRLTGQAYDEGKSGTAASVATIMLVSWLGFIIHGTSAMIPPGTPVAGQLGADLRFRLPPPASGASEIARSSAYPSAS